MALSDNKQNMARGELYYAFTPELVSERKRCMNALHRYNSADASGEASRRELAKLWRNVVGDKSTLPAELPNAKDDEAQFGDFPWVQSPVHIDYGTNVKLGSNVYINANCTIIDTCLVTIGSRTMFGPNVSLYSGAHPLDPLIRNGIKGPETGKEIHIGEDCWLGGNVTILPGVTVGRGSTVGAGSVVTKDVPPFHVVAGNPARIIRKIETAMDLKQQVNSRANMGIRTTGDGMGARKGLAKASEENIEAITAGDAVGMKRGIHTAGDGMGARKGAAKASEENLEAITTSDSVAAKKGIHTAGDGMGTRKGAVKEFEKNVGITTAGDGMGGKKGRDKGWGFGNDDGSEKSSNARPGKKYTVPQSSLWDHFTED